MGRGDRFCVPPVIYIFRMKGRLKRMLWLAAVGRMAAVIWESAMKIGFWFYKSVRSRAAFEFLSD